jgi:histo-blood group ABO system transferase
MKVLNLNKKVALLLIATNKYVNFLQTLIESADKYFLPELNITYCIFTDNKANIVSNRQISWFKVEHQPWPGPSINRYDYFDLYSDYLKTFDYLYYSDVDMKFVDLIDDNILGKLVMTQHPGFYNKSPIEYSYDRNIKSKAYIPYGMGKQYYAGGFNGGESNNFLKMASTIKKWKSIDQLQNIIPIWHDESYMNKYCIDFPPSLVLSPSYCYPESWHIPFSKKLIALDKNHKQMRE